MIDDDSIIGDVDLCGSYGDTVAEVYDTLHPVTPGVLECAATVAGLAGASGSVLEFGVGTGRLACPMADLGLRVTGIDASAGMLERLAHNDPNGRVRGIRAGFGAVDLDERFDVVLGAFNALCCAPTQAEQIATLATMARHTATGGRVVLETFEPGRHHQLSGPETTVHPLGPERSMLESTQIHREAQMMVLTSTLLTGSAPRVAVTFLRYLWPSELDLMARMVGLRPVERWGGWDCTPFSGDSPMCVSVYESDGS